MFVFLAIYILASRELLNRKYLRLSEENKIKNLVNRNFKILKLLGFEISKYETLSEYRDRVKSDVTNRILDSLTFIDTYEDIIYADRQIDSAMVKQFEESHDVLKNELCDTKNIYRIFNL